MTTDYYIQQQIENELCSLTCSHAKAVRLKYKEIAQAVHQLEEEKQKLENTINRIIEEVAV